VVTAAATSSTPTGRSCCFARDILSRNPGAHGHLRRQVQPALPVAIREAGGVPLLWKTGHSLIKAKLKETGAPFAGEMSGHLFFGERWYGFDDAMYTAARLLEILSRTRPERRARRLPTSHSTPELNVPCAEGEHHAGGGRTAGARGRRAAGLPRRRGRHDRRPARGLRRRLRPDPRQQHHAGAGAALRGPHARGALHRIEAQMMAALRGVKPDAAVAAAAH
jgi:phosphomannomutase